MQFVFDYGIKIQSNKKMQLKMMHIGTYELDLKMFKI